ncbi:hypothetical protein BVG16_26800 [Paenibacillus selenitireducens]|uniref:Uncharacterized protein n=1 Tax=Paenibacillus selenitireducens TaxID=1324314 RepID=A0A1T2X1K9_9BACL|nr:hypothetical protein [Paenibacillus selenitireducens]OPA73705.1 hypothetical protein BVG16_26800 [Paenibacillus selenitireducens]
MNGYIVFVVVGILEFAALIFTGTIGFSVLNAALVVTLLILILDRLKDIQGNTFGKRIHRQRMKPFLDQREQATSNFESRDLPDEDDIIRMNKED